MHSFCNNKNAVQKGGGCRVEQSFSFYTDTNSFDLVALHPKFSKWQVLGFVDGVKAAGDDVLMHIFNTLRGVYYLPVD